MNGYLKLGLIVFLGLGVFFTIQNLNKSSFKNPVLDNFIPKPTPANNLVPQQNEERYVFVPYWTFDKNFVTDSEHRLIYFGLGINELGIEENDKGFEKLKQFSELALNSKEKILAIRMTDAAINSQVLKDQRVEESIVDEAIKHAVENDFDALMLDFETSAFAFDSTVSNISDFYALFSSKVKENNLKFYVTLFGDNYIKARAYDVKKIGVLSDKVFIMTYDYHKSRGNPGPNFPLIDNRNYGYDLSKMVQDFQKDIENPKLVVVLGYFGYDWRIGRDQKAASTGVPLSTNEIKKEFIDNCDYKKCNLVRDKETQEPSISYVDDSNNSHVIWFEDEISVNKKIELLKSRGILEIGYWAYSYY